MGRAANNCDVTNFGGIPSVYPRRISLKLSEEVATSFLEDKRRIFELLRKHHVQWNRHVEFLRQCTLLTTFVYSRDPSPMIC